MVGARAYPAARPAADFCPGKCPDRISRQARGCLSRRHVSLHGGAGRACSPLSSCLELPAAAVAGFFPKPLSGGVTPDVPALACPGNPQARQAPASHPPSAECTEARVCLGMTPSRRGRRVRPALDRKGPGVSFRRSAATRGQQAGEFACPGPSRDPASIESAHRRKAAPAPAHPWRARRRIERGDACRRNDFLRRRGRAPFAPGTRATPPCGWSRRCWQPRRRCCARDGTADDRGRVALRPGAGRLAGGCAGRGAGGVVGMSDVVASLVLGRRTGSATSKAVLLFLARRAHDDGRGTWLTKKAIAADLEMSKRTVQRAVGELRAAGLIAERREPGPRDEALGPWAEFRIDLAAVDALPATGGPAPHNAAPIGFRKRLRVFQRTGWRCGYCGAEADLTIDHKVPRSRGGSNDEANLIAACASCNSANGAKTEAEFRVYLAKEGA